MPLIKYWSNTLSGLDEKRPMTYKESFADASNILLLCRSLEEKKFIVCMDHEEPK